MINDQNDDLSLNPSLESIAKIAGEDAAIQISIDFGGTRIYIPQSPGEHAPLTICVGLDAAKKIAQTYGGMNLTVPVTVGKRAEIENLNKQGYTAAQIARKVRCSMSMVNKVRAEIANRDQMSLPL